MTAPPSPAAAPRAGVLLLNLGGPDSLEAVDEWVRSKEAEDLMDRVLGSVSDVTGTVHTEHAWARGDEPATFHGP